MEQAQINLMSYNDCDTQLIIKLYEYIKLILKIYTIVNELREKNEEMISINFL